MSAQSQEKGGGFEQRSPWMRVLDETRQSWRQRRPLIQALERLFNGRTVITYLTSFAPVGSPISDVDAEKIEEVLHATHISSGVLLILNSAGGSALAAERIVNVCREWKSHSREWTTRRQTIRDRPL